MPDPERRANFHLRYLRDRPRIKTACCSREHCFKCRIKDFHEGKTCMESTEALDHSVVACPFCGISLTKGDGCNTITCVCGKQFSWSAEKENMERCQQFLDAFPHHTSEICASILCTSFTKVKHPRVVYKCKPSKSVIFETNAADGLRGQAVGSNVVMQAKAWQVRHRVEVSREMRNLFETVHWPSPSQCCATISSHINPAFVREEGMREAADIWKAEHSKQVEKCSSQNAHSIQSLMTTFYPNLGDRAAAALQLASLHRGSTGLGDASPFNIGWRLAESARLWIDAHMELFQELVESTEIRVATQFLHLYGTKSPLYTQAALTFIPSVFEWCRRISNTDLTYSNDNTTVERVGSVSCYPAAFASLVAEHCSFKVVLDVAPKSSNWITFGLARKGMPSSSSDGVGRTAQSWGLSDDRSSSSSHCILAASGQECGTFRKLKAGDVLSAMVLLNECLCEVAVNENELVHRFTIPPGTVDDFYFAMTFANDHRVSILYDGNTVTRDILTNSKLPQDPKQTVISPPPFVVLNKEQTQMLNALKKQIKAALAYINTGMSSPGTRVPPFLLMNLGSTDWQNIFGGDYDEALRYYRMILPEVEALVGLRRLTPSSSSSSTSSSSSSQEGSSLAWLSWNAVLGALVWYKNNKELIQQEEDMQLAQEFCMLHGDDAAFVAAMNLVEYHAHRVDNESEVRSF